MATTTSVSSGSLTTLPLTGIFTPPPSCLTIGSITWYSQASEAGSPRTIAPIIGESCPSCWLGVSGDNSSCYPPYWNPDVLYEPGACPSGYSAACSSTYTTGSNSETRTTCCPSGYTCQTSGWPWMSTEPCASPYNSNFEFAGLSVGASVIGTQTAVGTTVPLVSISSATVTLNADYLNGFALYAYAIQVATTTSNATSGNPNTLSTNPGDGLSTGAKAGIGIGVGLFFLGFNIVAWYFLRYRRKQQDQRVGRGEGGSGRPEGDALKLELDSQPPRGPAELETANPNSQSMAIHAYPGQY